jgi:uncharacterized LabA/DUF88 family protein
MDRAAVFVDAGYLFAAGSMLVLNEKLRRSDIHLDHDVVIKVFSDLAQELARLPLLRIYWYDGTDTGPTPQQLTLAYRPSVKLRLGFANRQGEQKGVDSLVVTDLINLARNRAMADAVLLTGDEDIRVGVQQAQEFGVRVHLVGIAPARSNQSGFLVQEADSVRELSFAEVQTFLSRVPSLVAPLPARTGRDTLESVAQAIAEELSAEEKRAVLSESQGGSVPVPVDRRLLKAGTDALGGELLTSEQKRRLRAVFIAACRNS